MRTLSFQRGCIALQLCLLALLSVPLLRAQVSIPEAAWRRPIGQPLANPGGKKPEINYPMFDDGYWQGAPVGGFGAGTFSRSYRGNFERWHIKAGIHKSENVPANQFAVYEQSAGGQPVAMALSTQKPENGALSSWKWSYPAGDGEYAALYPKSWFSYKTAQLPVPVTVEQFSPVIPGNYKESSYPVAVYRWTAKNPTDKPVTVSILFSWTNMIGWFRDNSANFNGALNYQQKDVYREEKLAAGPMQGIVFDRIREDGVGEEWDGQFAIAAQGGEGVEITYLTTYSPNGNGSEVWTPFASDGRLPNTASPMNSSKDQMAGAIAVRFTLQPGETRSVPMTLSWDLPVIQFGGGRRWVRHYTRFFGQSGTNAWAIAKEALQHNQEWSAQIDAWQKPYAEDTSKPLWYRGELFNELYILTDGGTVWAHELNKPGNPNHPSSFKNDSFSFAECYDYPFYGSLDVRFYGALPLAALWPEIEKQEMRQYADTVPESNPAQYMWGWRAATGHPELMPRQVPGSVVHDLGTPLEDPFVLPNQYTWQNGVKWRDLNSKYVLMVWRDYYADGQKDKEFLRYSYKAVKLAMQFLRQYDTDGDGLIENGGFPDQTYDNWTARGESAYSGGLYLAALRASEEIAKVLGDKSYATENAELFARAQKAYIAKLWNGKYFNYDYKSPYKTEIQAAQIAGQWAASMSGLGDILPVEMRRSALRTIFEHNVMQFKNGTLGAVNGMGANGELMTSNESEEEVWSGVTFGLASQMLSEGMRDEAYTTAKGIYNVVWAPDGKGYWFRTPEAWDIRGYFRAGMYMRPAAIWGMEMVKPPAKTEDKKDAEKK
jgi:non-lysosomal glucosylceramidase